MLKSNTNNQKPIFDLVKYFIYDFIASDSDMVVAPLICFSTSSSLGASSSQGWVDLGVNLSCIHNKPEKPHQENFQAC